MERIASTVDQLTLEFREYNQNGDKQKKLLQSNVQDFVEEHKDLARLRKIVDSLYFEGIKTRYSSIPKSYERTSEWIFNGSKTLFPEWLESQGGMFWIAEKPGSGKSTLMKFLPGHQQTRELINRNGGTIDYCIASHFFWSSGTALQKSIEGLLRTLLHRILRKCPGLVPALCSERWLSRHTEHVFIEPWTYDELLQAFERLSSPECRPDVEFTFFIDGLDEFGGNHRFVVELCRNWPCPRISRFASLVDRTTSSCRLSKEAHTNCFFKTSQEMIFINTRRQCSLNPTSGKTTWTAAKTMKC